MLAKIAAVSVRLRSTRDATAQNSPRLAPLVLAALLPILPSTPHPPLLPPNRPITFPALTAALTAHVPPRTVSIWRAAN